MNLDWTVDHRAQEFWLKFDKGNGDQAKIDINFTYKE